jgi:hypothetical protein
MPVLDTEPVWEDEPLVVDCEYPVPEAEPVNEPDVV